MTDERKERKIVQVAVAPPTQTDEGLNFAAVYALADDGTLWVAYSTPDEAWSDQTADCWNRIPSLPRREVSDAHA